MIKEIKKWQGLSPNHLMGSFDTPEAHYSLFLEKVSEGWCMIRGWYKAVSGGIYWNLPDELVEKPLNDVEDWTNEEIWEMIQEGE